MVLVVVLVVRAGGGAGAGAGAGGGTAARDAVLVVLVFVLVLMVPPFINHLGHVEREQPQLGDLLTMVINHLLNVMILQVQSAAKNRD